MDEVPARSAESSSQAPRMEMRLYTLLCLASALLAFCVVLPCNLLLHISPVVNLGVAVFGAACALLYRSSCRGRHHVRTLFALLLLLLNVIWFSNGASLGSVSFYFFPAFIYSLIFFRRRERWLMLAVAMANVTALMGAELLFPYLVVPYRTPRDRVVDLVVGMLMSGVTSALMLYVVLADYDREQKELKRLVEELRENIAERRLAELALHEKQEEIRRINEELDQRVKERTARLEAAIREQEAFSYSVSHDLRAPLRHINSYCAIVEEEFAEKLPEEARGYLEKVRSASSKLGKLIDALLEMSRISRSEIRPDSVDLTDIAEEISRALRECEPQRNVEFLIARGLTVRGDRVLLRLVLENLLGNAWKYTARRAQATIEVGRVLNEGREIFFVRDNGTGFDMLYKDRLFGAFERLHGSDYEGTGIGLATVKRVIERHHGSVWAEAEVDRGTTVLFTLNGPP